MTTRIALFLIYERAADAGAALVGTAEAAATILD